MLKQNTSIKHLIALLVIGCLLGLVALNSVRFMGLFSQPESSVSLQTNIPKVSAKQKLPSPEMISSWNLFGKAATESTRAPKTNLRIKLIGIISSTSDGQARAIIEESSRKHKHYKVGDKIKNNVTIKSIQPDHIVIVHNSRDEIVPLNALRNKNSIIKKVVIQ